jgi:hypothetical protein
MYVVCRLNWVRRQTGEHMHTVKEAAAAAMLSVCSSTLHDWEARFGYPRSTHLGQDRVYDHDQLLALGEALRNASSISAAIARARGAVGDRRDNGGHSGGPVEPEITPS